MYLNSRMAGSETEVVGARSFFQRWIESGRTMIRPQRCRGTPPNVVGVVSWLVTKSSKRTSIQFWGLGVALTISYWYFHEMKRLNRMSRLWAVRGRRSQLGIVHVLWLARMESRGSRIQKMYFISGNGMRTIKGRRVWSPESLPARQPVKVALVFGEYAAKVGVDQAREFFGDFHVVQIGEVPLQITFPCT